MALFTPNFDLPYPDALDAPCDFAQQWCQFSDAFQTVLDGFQATVDRTVPAIPMARLMLTTPVTVASLQAIPFDTLSMDTAGWVDFDADPTTITVDRGGYIVAIANAEYTTIAGDTDFAMTLQTSLGTVSDQQQINSTGTNLGFVVAVLLQITTPTTFQIYVSTGTNQNMSVTRATLSVFWHSDRATP